MFRFSKWYCDCVTDEGSAFVGYWARMGWGPFALPYAAAVYRTKGEPTRERYSLRTSRAPTSQGEVLRWDCDRLGVRGIWSQGAPAVSRTLLETPDGTIEWNCRLPSARAQIDLDGIGRLSGLGYAEHLAMTVKPWKLPFDQLRWGRFLSAEDAVTWIEWRGVETNRWVFHNGLELCVQELVDFSDGDILDYSYVVFRGEERIRWYDPQPHPENPELASTFPHHLHEPPDLKHNRKPAPGVSFQSPNLHPPFSILNNFHATSTLYSGNL